jgi:hypothetical protein
MRFKHELAAFRPADYSWQVQPLITTPGHGSTPSGHCTQSYLLLTVLQALLNSTPVNADGTDAESIAVAARQRSINVQMERTAARISTNRVIAGVHFPVDNVAGRLLGTVLGEYFVYRCKKAPDKVPVCYWHQAAFDGLQFPAGEDFNPARQGLVGASVPTPYYTYQDPDHEKVAPPESLLQTLWEAAAKELKELQEGVV